MVGISPRGTVAADNCGDQDKAPFKRVADFLEENGFITYSYMPSI